MNIKNKYKEMLKNMNDLELLDSISSQIKVMKNIKEKFEKERSMYSSTFIYDRVHIAFKQDKYYMHLKEFNIYKENSGILKEILIEENRINKEIELKINEMDNLIYSIIDFIKISMNTLDYQ